MYFYSILTLFTLKPTTLATLSSQANSDRKLSCDLSTRVKSSAFADNTTEDSFDVLLLVEIQYAFVIFARTKSNGTGDVESPLPVSGLNSSMSGRLPCCPVLF